MPLQHLRNSHMEDRENVEPNLPRLTQAMLLSSLLFLAGCEQTVYSNLSEQHANDVLLTLLKGGISAEKRGGEKGFSIWVDSSKMAPAISLLNANGQPPQHYADLGEIFARNSLISSPTEERIRFTYGMDRRSPRPCRR